MFLYFFVFLFSFIISLILTNGIKRFSLNYGFHDVPDNERKIHVEKIPTLGGLAFFASVWGTFILLDATGITPLEKIVLRMISISLFFIFVGILDDIKGVSAKLKLFIQVFAGSLFFLWNKNDLAIIYGNLLLTNTVLTFVSAFFFALLTNSINFVDGLDGLCAGVSIILSIPLLIFSIVIGKTYISYIILSCIGALFAFLFFNFYPAKIFMGDTGSLFLGSLFSMIVMLLMYHIPENWTPFIILFTYPFLDLFLSVIRRFLGKRNIFAPDRLHIHHIIKGNDGNHTKSVIVIYSINLFFAILSVLLFFLKLKSLYILYFVSIIVVSYYFLKRMLIRMKEKSVE
ncbi:MAG: MraY family glycosyltransferase [candidate division WOR-3 bacterium]